MEAQTEECASTIRVTLASDVRVYRQALERLLEGTAGIEVVGTAATSGEAVEQAQSLAPSVVLLDMAMMDAYGAAKQISRLSTTCRVVALGVPEIELEVITCAEVGISGYVTRDGSMLDVVDAIRAAARGEVACSPRITGYLFRRIAAMSTERNGGSSSGLTAREEQIVRLLQQGFSNKMISRSLGIELPTVKNHLHSIFVKLGVHRRAEAVSLLYRQKDDDSRTPRVRGNGA